ncbi:PAS domain-containing protein [Bradyrhizobium elkanii]|uniref:PAS domain-containing protein n=1 Tax=Bradyrhizobium elkanii TaxID=29448 RepID=UPI0014493F85|nr:PAS domain-containing protein [Bradyrhizobium elkanii]MCS3583690.1 hypothetical protein [Bradyrhizobium elkanii]MCS3717260.1 hypothetical protein [Bradyrhizobium elkanii]MCS4010978.1 hypothetical protein [Bradyrhizobium elkanii USDA 61]BBB96839.1 hypothetical protein BE61_22700 [Bradyrhizobium elkanii USDA 61]
MQRFIEQQNIARFKHLLSHEATEVQRRLLQALLASAQRRLALIEASERGTYSGAQIVREQLFPRTIPKLTSAFQREFEAASTPLLLVEPGPGLQIVEANKIYAAATMIDASKVAGEKMFDIFPDNPNDAAADGVANLFKSLNVVATTGQSHAMRIQRYDVRDANGVFVKRYWQPVNSPVLDDSGKIAFLLHQVIDVTERHVKKSAA